MVTRSGQCFACAAGHISGLQNTGAGVIGIQYHLAGVAEDKGEPVGE